MNKKAQFDFEADTETFIAIGLGILTGFLAVFVMKGAGLGLFWKIATFIASGFAGYIVSWLILTK